MEKEMIDALITGYNSGKLTEKEMSELEQLIEGGVVSLSDLSDFTLFEKNLTAIESPSPSLKMDDAFYEMLAREKKSVKVFDWKGFFNLSVWAPRLAFASVA